MNKYLFIIYYNELKKTNFNTIFKQHRLFFRACCFLGNNLLLLPCVLTTHYKLCLFSGWSCRQPVWHPGLSVCGAFSELADPRATMESFWQAAGHLHLFILLWPASLDRQLCPHLWFCVWVLPLLHFPAVHQVSGVQLKCFQSPPTFFD